MYSVKYKGDNGKEIVLGKDGGIVCDVNFGEGLTVNMSLAQGFKQIGESVQGESVGGKMIKVKGVIFNDVRTRKVLMRDVFAPFTAGYLIFENRYKIRVHVKSTPAFSTNKTDGRFMLQLFAPDPFFYSLTEKSEIVGEIEPKFSFPINYAEPHMFGDTSMKRDLLLNNTGNVPVPYSLELTSISGSLNPVLTNLRTFEFLKINGLLGIGDKIKIYRNEDGILRADLIHDGDTSDILSWVDESSTFYSLDAGENLVAINDEGGGFGLMARISFSPAVSAVYES